MRTVKKFEEYSVLATHTLVQKMNQKIEGLVKMNELFIMQIAFFTPSGFQKLILLITR